MKNKKYGAWLFLGTEVILFSGMYFFGANGVVTVIQAQHEIADLQQEIGNLKEEINQLHEAITLQQKHPFFQEKIAREQLQMARETEEIYLL